MQRLPLLLLVGLLCSSCAAADKYALLVGVTTYQKAQMNENKINFPEADAVAMGKVLEASGYTVVRLLGRQATRTAIEEALTELRTHGAAGGIVLIGLFGHGVQYNEDAFFCPWDSTLRVVKDSAGRVLSDKAGQEMLEPDPVSLISMKQLLDALNACGADNRVIFADCCREDPSAARTIGHRAFGSRVRTADLKEGTAALFSCSQGERAFEHAEWGHGALTKAFLDYYDSMPADGNSDVYTMMRPLHDRVKALVQDKAPGNTQKVNPITNGLVDLQLKPKNRAQKLTNSIGQDLMLIPAGSFLMGSPDGDSERYTREGPQHRVEITKAFYMGRTEVTQGQWRGVMGTEPWKGKSYTQEGDQNAASYINWDDATEFCRLLSQREGKTYRLPTEAEWEYACRAGTTTRFHFGGDHSRLGEYAWFVTNAWDKDERYAHRVGQKKPNAYGLHDMHGNVWEWCGDWFDSDYYASSPLRDPRGPSSGYSRVFRGGSWLLAPGFVRCAYRYGNTPDFRSDDGGFRVVLE